LTKRVGSYPDEWGMPQIWYGPDKRKEEIGTKKKDEKSSQLGLLVPVGLCNRKLK
jgi:hypothetical protein